MSLELPRAWQEQFLSQRELSISSRTRRNTTEDAESRSSSKRCLWANVVVSIIEEGGQRPYAGGECIVR